MLLILDFCEWNGENFLLSQVYDPMIWIGFFFSLFLILLSGFASGYSNGVV